MNVIVKITRSVFLQILFDQYKNRCMYDTFNDYQRKEFEFLVAKYKLVRSEVYSL